MLSLHGRFPVLTGLVTCHATTANHPWPAPFRRFPYRLQRWRACIL